MYRPSQYRDLIAKAISEPVSDATAALVEDWMRQDTGGCLDGLTVRQFRARARYQEMVRYPALVREYTRDSGMVCPEWALERRQSPSIVALGARIAARAAGARS